MTATLDETGWAPTKGGVRRWVAEDFPEPDERELSAYGWTAVHGFVCQRCGAEFSTSSQARRYCSDECRIAARREQRARSDAKRPRRPERRKERDRPEFGPLPVDCPTCGVLAGASCRSPSMKTTRQHAARIRALESRGKPVEEAAQHAQQKI